MRRSGDAEACARLLQEAEESRQAQHAAGSGKQRLIGDLGLDEVRGGLGGIDADQGIFLRTEIDLVLT